VELLAHGKAKALVRGSGALGNPQEFQERMTSCASMQAMEGSRPSMQAMEGSRPGGPITLYLG
jgi:hypothetical protein